MRATHIATSLDRVPGDAKDVAEQALWILRVILWLRSSAVRVVNDGTPGLFVCVEPLVRWRYGRLRSGAGAYLVGSLTHGCRENLKGTSKSLTYADDGVRSTC